MKQIVLFPLLLESNLELGILLLIFETDHFSENILEEHIKSDEIHALFRNLMEHVLKPNHIKWSFLEWEFHDFEHHY